MRKLFLPFIILIISSSFCLAEDFAVIVNNETVPLSKFNRALQYALKEAPATVSSSQGQENIDEPPSLVEIKRSVLDNLIEGVLIEQGALKEGINITESEIKQKINEMKNTFPSSSEFHKALAVSGMTLDDLRSIIRSQLILERLKQKALHEVLITDEEIQGFYDRNKDLFVKKDRLKVKQIFTNDYDEALKIQEKLEKGTSFDELAKSHFATEDKFGWDLGFVEKGELPEEFDEVVFWLKQGEISPIIKSDDGYHIFKVTSKIPGKVTSLDEAKDNIKKYLKEEKTSAAFRKWLDEEKALADIKVNKGLEYLLQ